MFKKSTLLLATYNNFQCCCPHTGLPFPSFSTPPHPQQESDRPQRWQRRGFATVRSENGKCDDVLSWPAVSVPSPYQIFNLTPRDAYSKRRFYALVKVYHPDRSGHSHIHSEIHNLPGAVKMERYRLIVAANDILSDPDKRKAYDRTGAGWNGCMEHGLHSSRYDWSHRRGEARWSGFDTNDSPFHNATWEDWERWYNRHKRQQPAHTSNGGFLSLVIVAVIIGAFGQADQVSRHKEFFQQRTELQNEKALKTVSDHRQESQKAASMDSRLQGFFRRRDLGAAMPPGRSGFTVGEGNLLPEPVVCMSDTQRKSGGKDR